MSLITIKDACLSFSNLEILKTANMQIHNHEKISLMGKNGAGKSTILKIINKQQDLDSGTILYQKYLKIAYLKQDNPSQMYLSTYDFISTGFFPTILNKIYPKSIITKKEILSYQEKLKIHQLVQIEKMIEKMQLNKNTILSETSGGLLRKIALAQVLIQEPDILLLDEPTNHLDIKAITWLEYFLKKISGSILFVSHDRSFIQNVSTRIIDLDRGKITSWPGNYENFIKLKNDRNRIEIIHKKLFDQYLEKEETWIKKGIKARCTRNEGRVKNLNTLRQKKENYKKIEKIKNITINQLINHTGKIVFKLENINFSINKKMIINDFSTIIQHGDKIGLIGDNGCGKSTLIKIIIGENIPQKGKIYIGTGLKKAYFDQNRSVLNPEKSILNNIDFDTEKIILNGKKQHIIGYLKNFLFQPHQINTLVKTLSGGECNRLLLARIFLKPSNVLILDEPTNDLDLDTLQLLENIIMSYQGTVLIVSHDRKFIENTANKYWKFEKNGNISINFGKYNPKLEKKNNLIIKKNKQKKTKNINNKDYQLNIKSEKKNKKAIKNLLRSIEKTELDISIIQNQLNEPSFFKQNIEKKLPILNLLSKKEKELEQYLKKWEDLEK